MYWQECEALRQHDNAGDGAVETVDVRKYHCGVPGALIFSGHGPDVRKICRDAPCLTPDRLHLPVNHLIQNMYCEDLANFSCGRMFIFSIKPLNYASFAI